MSDPTQTMPAAGGPDEPGDGSRLDQRQKIILGAVGGFIVLLIVVLLLVALGDDDGTDVATTSTSGDTTSSSVESTTSSVETTTTTDATTTTSTTTTTVAPPATTTTTTTTPPPTVKPSECTGNTGPTNPEPVAMVFYEAWTLDDVDCAEKVATDDAIDTLFAASGDGANWTFQGCDTVEDPEPHMECAWSYEGGASFFTMDFGAIDGWRVTTVDFVAD